MKIKRLLSWLLMCAMLLSMLPGMAITGAAESGTFPEYTASRVEDISKLSGNSSKNGFTVAAVIWKDAENANLFYLAIAGGSQHDVPKEWHTYKNNQTLTVNVKGGAPFSHTPKEIAKNNKNTECWYIKTFSRPELEGALTPSGGDYILNLNLPEGFALAKATLPGDFVKDEIIGNAITKFTKVLVTNEPSGVEPNIPKGVTVTYPTSGSVTIPADGSVTLLYKLTVTGKAGADFTITDQNAKLVGSDCSAEEKEGKIVGNIPQNGTATIYVTKTFKANDINSDGNVINEATITSKGGVDKGKETATAKTLAKKGETPEPIAPRELNEDELKTVEVKVSCTNSVAGHTLQTYHLTSAECSSKIISEVLGTYQCVVTLDCQAFAGKYQADGYPHTLYPEDQSQQVTFTWDKEKQTWSAPQNDSIDIYVKCAYTPEPQYAITGFDKNLVESAVAIPNYVTVSGISYPADGKVIIPADGSATLLYKLTVTGKAGADFAITDQYAKLVGSNCNAAQASDGGEITGNIPTGQTAATIYVTKTFKADDINNVTGKVTNEASITTNDQGGVAGDVGNPKVETPAEEGKPGAPNADTIKNLLTDKISVSCITASTAHPSGTYGWMNGGCTLPTDVTYNNVAGTWEYVITINAGVYVNDYDTAKLELPAGTHVQTGNNYTITLTWGRQGWSCDDRVDIEATCSLCTLTYDANNGKFKNGDESFQVTGIPKGTDYTLEKETNYVDPTRPGAVFCGWTTKDEAIAKVYGLNEELPQIVIGMSINGDRTVYAIWQEEEPTTEWVSITFNSGEHGDFGWYYHNSKDVELTKGGKLAADQIPTVYPDNGYKFVGWYKQGSGSWYLYSNEELQEKNFDSAATFIAQYKRTGGSGVDVDDDYDVIYNANFTDGSYPRRMSCDEGDKVTVSENKWFEREGYTFIGWNTKANGNGDSYDPDDTFKMPDSDVYLYAQWQKNKPGPDDTGVSRWLETEDHNAYLTGYPDSTFGADRNMTRAEVAQMFYALLKNKNVMITTSFSDVSNDAWYATAVKTMASLGMMSGYPDGTFRPDEPITRAEFATVALAFAYEPDNARCSYLDVSTSAWYYTYVAQATTYGWIGGYPDGTFRPNNSITRVEVCVIVNNMLGRTPDEDYIDRNEDELVNFVDLSDRYWGYYTIMEATNGHEYTGNYSNETWESVK